MDPSLEPIRDIVTLSTCTSYSRLPNTVILLLACWLIKTSLTLCCILQVQWCFTDSAIGRWLDLTWNWGWSEGSVCSRKWCPIHEFSQPRIHDQWLLLHNCSWVFSWFGFQFTDIVLLLMKSFLSFSFNRIRTSTRNHRSPVSFCLMCAVTCGRERDETQRAHEDDVYYRGKFKKFGLLKVWSDDLTQWCCTF